MSRLRYTDVVDWVATPILPGILDELTRIDAAAEQGLLHGPIGTYFMTHENTEVREYAVQVLGELADPDCRRRMSARFVIQ